MTNKDWITILENFLQQEQKLKAVKINLDQKKVSLATVGNVDVKLLQDKLDQVLRTLDEKFNIKNVVDNKNITGSSEKNSSFVLNQNDTGSIIVQKDLCPTVSKAVKWRDFSWPDSEEIEQESKEEWQSLAIQAAISGVCLVLAWLLAKFNISPWIVISFYTVSLIGGAWDAAKEAYNKIFQGGLDIHFLMLAVAIGAVSIGAWNEGALLLFLFSLSGAMEHYALHRTHREINALTKAAPKMAKVIDSQGNITEKPVIDLEVGEHIVVGPDQLFPVDGIVIKGDTAVDESNLTGESVPVDKKENSEVFSGSLNLWGSVTIAATKLASQSALQKIIDLIKNSQNLRAPSQRFTDKFGTGYTWFVLTLTMLMFFVWWLFLGHQAFINDQKSSAFYLAMTLLVVMSPCALALSIPSAILAAIAWGAKNGILFRGGAAIEKLAEVDLVAMDKTGTLTEGEMKVRSVESFPAGKENEVSSLAYSLESKSNHPIARAIINWGRINKIQQFEINNFRSISGHGVRAEVNNVLCYASKRELLDQPEFSNWIKEIPSAPLGFTEVWIFNKTLLGRILLEDTIRSGSRELLSSLTKNGIKTVMLTGDRQAAAEKIAQELGLTEILAGLKPEDKVQKIKELGKQGYKVAMIGDGVNDAPSLAAAYVSIAMGARGSDAALEQSDIVLMQDKIEKFLTARNLSLRARSIIRQNLLISLGAISIMAISALFSLVPLTLGVLTHEGSTVIVCLNSLRLLFTKDKLSA